MATPVGCDCCAGFGTHRLDRRWLLGAMAAAVPLRGAWAKGKYGDYEAMVLSCIDPRMQKPVFSYLTERELVGKYSSFTIAGAAIGVVAPAFDKWHKAFWENLATSIELHHIKSVIAIDHRDCGAAKIAYGETSIATREAEDATHRQALAEFRRMVAERHPGLGVETILMGLDGSEMMLG